MEPEVRQVNWKILKGIKTEIVVSLGWELGGKWVHFSDVEICIFYTDANQ